MKKTEQKQIINTIEDCLNEATFDNAKFIVNHDLTKELIYPTYVIYDDANILYIIQVRVHEEFTRTEISLFKLTTVAGALFIDSLLLQKFENAIKKAELLINRKDAE